MYEQRDNEWLIGFFRKTMQLTDYSEVYLHALYNMHYKQ